MDDFIFLGVSYTYGLSSVATNGVLGLPATLVDTEIGGSSFVDRLYS